MIPDIERVDALMREAAAQEILPRFQMLREHEVSEKTGPNDLVTDADLGVEAYLERRLAEMLPGSTILGEEAAAADRSLLATIDNEDWVWVIDPVDGTYNFAHGKEDFAIIVALVHRGAVVAGWIHYPLEEDSLTAEQGSGAFLGGERVRVATALPISEMSGALYIGKKRAPQLHEHLKTVRDALGPLSYTRCVAMEYRGLATGRLHYAIFTLQLPWDHAAGCHIISEAGGYLALIDGSPYLPRGSTTPLLIAPDTDSWRALRDYLAPFAAAS